MVPKKRSYKRPKHAMIRFRFTADDLEDENGMFSESYQKSTPGNLAHFRKGCVEKRSVRINRDISLPPLNSERTIRQVE